MRLCITWCEWPDGCRAHGYMDPAHIRAKGHGGGRRKDTLENIAMLCRAHHNLYDHKLGQSRERQAWLRKAIRNRPTWLKKQILAMARG